ncbi:hypothetical protein FD754_020612 [Muntiacus muntjak]|uniref:Uncharacterized protein n=1 Tax=Muntiacus muntjak TaxID=9888 RepID=A0A5N3V3E3_MUNMU|nr:hypothetical protein FD754_020612 [Muntiacus muntjak]
MNRPALVEISYENMSFLMTHNPTNATVNKFEIHVLDWPFDGRAPPPNQIVDDWLSPLKTKYREEPGLGRAPVQVALALTECGIKGAFNSKQLLYLEKY